MSKELELILLIVAKIEFEGGQECSSCYQTFGFYRFLRGILKNLHQRIK